MGLKTRTIVEAAILVGIIKIAIDINKIAGAVGNRKIKKHKKGPAQIADDYGEGLVTAADETITPPKGGPHYLNVIVLPPNEAE